MKTTNSFLVKVIFVLGGLSIIVSSCKKKDDPVPDDKPKKHTLTLQPGSEGKDAHLTSYGPTGNYGSSTYNLALAWTAGGPTYGRAVMDFDLSSIPAKAKITSATLTLYADTSYVYYGAAALEPGHSTLSGDNDGSLKRITQAWDESTVTWNTQPTVDEVNKVTLPVSTVRSQAYELDVTAMIKDQYKNPESYFGFMLMLNNETAYRGLLFYSSDSPYSSVRPKLVIKYEK